MSAERPDRTQQTWPDSLDALIAAPDHHTLLFENERVRVVRTRILPGEKVPLHTHRCPAMVFIQSWSDLVRRDPTGNVTMDTRGMERPEVNAPMWQEALPPHTVENVGSQQMIAVAVEIKVAV
jgi:hypothetical protein